MSETPKPKSFVKGRGQALEGQVIAPKKPQKRAPTTRQIKAAQLMAENGRKSKPLSKGQIMKEAGYSEEIQNVPSKVTNSPVFQDLLNEFIPDNDLATVHKRLLQTRKIEHMIFPLGPENEDDENLSGAQPNAYNPIDGIPQIKQRTTLTDQEIKDMLAEVNCVVKRVVHGETARHVYYWAHDANAQTKALELAYKMKGHLGKGDTGGDKSPFNFNVFQGGQTFVKKGDQ